MVRANYILLDSAKMESDLAIARDLNPEHTCLYEGDNEKYYSVVAPWLFDFEEGSEFGRWISSQAGGNDWGVFLRSSEDPRLVYEHLRKFLVVKTEDGQELFFRFYDPRVLRVFLPTCDREQLKAFFGPIEAFIVEDENGLLVEYGYSDESLKAAPLNKKMGALGEGQKQNQSPGQKSSAPADTRASHSEVAQESDISNRQNVEPDQEDRKSNKKDLGWDFGY